jgi:hypothetical protein
VRISKLRFRSSYVESEGAEASSPLRFSTQLYRTLDGLGAAAVVSTSTNYNAVVGVCPETYIRVTTGSSVTLPTPSAANLVRGTATSWGLG